MVRLKAAVIQELTDRLSSPHPSAAARATVDSQSSDTPVDSTSESDCERADAVGKRRAQSADPDDSCRDSRPTGATSPSRRRDRVRVASGDSPVPPPGRNRASQVRVAGGYSPVRPPNLSTASEDNVSQDTEQNDSDADADMCGPVGAGGARIAYTSLTAPHAIDAIHSPPAHGPCDSPHMMGERVVAPQQISQVPSHTRAQPTPQTATNANDEPTLASALSALVQKTGSASPPKPTVPPTAPPAAPEPSTTPPSAEDILQDRLVGYFSRTALPRKRPIAGAFASASGKRRHHVLVDDCSDRVRGKSVRVGMILVWEMGTN